MLYQAILHKGNPGPNHNKNVMSNAPITVVLETKFSDIGDLVVSARANFVASKPGNPRYATIWDGSRYCTTLRVEVTGTPNHGDSVYTTLTWILPLTQLIID
jgi:hypothetical protein